jgi:hypothetical protein
MSRRNWKFDMSMKCPYCGKHELWFSEPTCVNTSNILDKDIFVMLKLKEFDRRLKELEPNEVKIEEEKEELSGS